MGQTVGQVTARSRRAHLNAAAYVRQHRRQLAVLKGLEVPGVLPLHVGSRPRSGRVNSVPSYHYKVRGVGPGRWWRGCTVLRRHRAKGQWLPRTRVCAPGQRGACAESHYCTRDDDGDGGDGGGGGGAPCPADGSM